MEQQPHSAAPLSALAVLVAAAPYARLPDELLPRVAQVLIPTCPLNLKSVVVNSVYIITTPDVIELAWCRADQTLIV